MSVGDGTGGGGVGEGVDMADDWLEKLENAEEDAPWLEDQAENEDADPWDEVELLLYPGVTESFEAAPERCTYPPYSCRSL